MSMLLITAASRLPSLDMLLRKPYSDNRILGWKTGHRIEQHHTFSGFEGNSCK